MSYIEGSYKQLLFGVSQQEYKDRLEGQNEEQVNMVSDIATNLRRRPPMRFRNYTGITTDPARLAFYNSTIKNTRLTLVADTLNNQMHILGANGLPVQAPISNSYLATTDPTDIKFTTLGDSIFIANTSVQPTLATHPDASGLPVAPNCGYFYVVAGQFGKTYNLKVLNSLGPIDVTVSYTTPSGAAVGDAALSTPEYIAQQLRNAAAADGNIGTSAGVTWTVDGAYVFARSAFFYTTISSNSGSNFIRTSLNGTIRTVGDLPARLPNAASGYIIGVGTTKISTYYRWDVVSQSWLEDAKYGQFQYIQNMPIRFRWDSPTGQWVLPTPTYERRTAGDLETNPNPYFTAHPISGIGSFQRRLVILSDNTVSMSATNKPLRWYRSTVNSVESDDTIEISSTAGQSTPYQWALPFNSDLILWADQFQSLIPGDQAVTPANASVSVISQYEAQLGSAPVATGRSTFFGTKRLADFSGVWEAVPGDTDSTQLLAADVTNHIPRYIPGNIRFMAASSTSGILVAGYTSDTTQLLVHEYLWQGNEKAHHSWHKWQFDWAIRHAWFVADTLNMLISHAGQLSYVSLNLREGGGEVDPTTVRLDLQVQTVANSNSHLVVDSGIAAELVQDSAISAVRITGGDPYVPQKGFLLNVSGGVHTFALSEFAPGETFIIGRPYTSTVVPTAPSVRDQNDVPITTARALIHKWVLTLRNSGEFRYTISDKFRASAAVDTSPLQLGSPELNIGNPQVASGQQYIPARLDMPTSRLELSTDGVYDMNITSLEYGFRYNQRYGRRQ